LDRQCPALKRDGSQCSGSVTPGKYHCWWHNPENTDKRRRAASRGGKGNKSKVSKDLHKLLERLTEQVVSGELEPYPASVAGSLVGVRLRLLEYERRVKETDTLELRLEELEAALGNTGGGGYGTAG
jgi:hypothetical protein